jgi:basic membrane protein A and related proteins
MTHSLNRRSFLKTSLAAGTALALPVPAFAADALNVALIVPSPVADVGWSHTLMQGVEALRDVYGEGLKITLLENIAEGPDADRIMNKTVADGNTLVILGSFGYMNGGLKLAKMRPDVAILHASGYQVAPNFSPFGARYYQGTYLMGMAAASLSKTKKLGCVGAFAIPELITSINAFTLGRRAWTRRSR